ncbi:MAG: mechanosensitive ion channel [Saprospiraceae bacterium]|nr:mechanosensitive ion channel [Saprospiraceae bacterium]
MQNLTSWSEIFIHSLRSFGEKLMVAVPAIIGAILILILGWLIAKLFQSITRQVLKLLKINQLAERIKATDMLEKANIQTSPIDLIAKFVYWLLLLLVIITASDTLGWSTVSNEISKLVEYLPSLVAAILFFIVGIYVASFVRDLIKGTTTSLGISVGMTLSNVVYYILLVLISLTALDQAGIDTQILHSNSLLILGTVLITGAISYGLASRDMLANILGSYVGKRSFKIGQTIEMDGVKGKILEINSVNLVIQTQGNTKVVIPTNKLMTNKVTILD